MWVREIQVLSFAASPGVHYSRAGTQTAGCVGTPSSSRTKGGPQKTGDPVETVSWLLHLGILAHVLLALLSHGALSISSVLAEASSVHGIRYVLESSCFLSRTDSQWSYFLPRLSELRGHSCSVNSFNAVSWTL